MQKNTHRITALLVVVGISINAMDWVSTPDCQKKDIEEFYDKVLSELDSTMYHHEIDRSTGLAHVITNVKQQMSFKNALAHKEIYAEAQHIFYSIIQSACEEGKRPEIYWKWYLHSLQLTITSITIPPTIRAYDDPDMDCDLAMIKENKHLEATEEHRKKLCSFLLAQSQLACFLERNPHAFSNQHGITH